MITKDELDSMIAALESQPHLSMREEKYLAIMKEMIALTCAYQNFMAGDAP